MTWTLPEYTVQHPDDWTAELGQLLHVYCCPAHLTWHMLSMTSRMTRSAKRRISPRMLATASYGDHLDADDPASVVLQENETLRGGLQRLKQGFERNLELLHERDDRIEYLEARVNDAMAATANMDSIKSENTELKRQLEALERKLDKTRSKNKESNNELLQTRRILSDHDAQLHEIEKAKHRAVIEAEHTAKLNQALESRVKELLEWQRSAEQPPPWDPEAGAVEERLRRDIAALQADVDELRAEKRHLAASEQTLRAGLDRAEQALWDQRKARDAAERRAGAAETELESMRVLLANAHGDQGSWRDRAATLENRVAELESEAAKARRSASRYKRQRDEARSRVTTVLRVDGGAASRVKESATSKNMRKIDKVVRQLREFDRDRR
ncbi:Chromosome partition protein Smc [Carpediemonas membranifera]|uniref:Chromosome partition protein Smc n=1 Tax=Carpediemonas membranifera TaxID=201153 RepID=A0A8J6B023_9EUKA|nr:Chromosome partition protein Smc [Carpediemonas membranifera]|eukprot:KAG9390077.1 Chromosome partition protein Smc [Carpediemonas membranifera]